VQIYNVLVFLILFLMPFFVKAQTGIYPNNEITEHTIDRLDILADLPVNFHSSIQNYYRKDIAELIDSSYFYHKFSERDRQDFEYIILDNSEYYEQDSFRRIELLNEGENVFIPITTTKPFLRHFYKSKANLFEFTSDDFQIIVNPVLNLKFGATKDNGNTVFQNTRGFDIRGSIDRKVYFYTSLFETQQRFNAHIEQRINRFNAVPGNGFYKDYQSGIIDGINGWDFLNAKAYVGLQISKSIGIEFGHGNHFIGNGYNSLLLDNYGHNYFYLKFNTKFWKLQYQNIFAELSAFGSRETFSNALLPKKYMAAHYLDLHLSKNFSLGIFEAVIFNRLNNFEFQYLNPVIIYRTVELFLDSPDNVLIGLNMKYNFAKQFQAYGQLVFDEFSINDLTAGDGWWGNKTGVQLGLKYMNAFKIDHLDLQVEYNQVRPYTYSHRDTIPGQNQFALASYSHYSQPLAHPLGANFREVLLQLRYAISPQLIFNAMFSNAIYGDNESNLNYGGNILESFETRIMDNGNFIGQGDRTSISQVKFDVSYQLRHNYFLDFNFLYRRQDAKNAQNDINTTFFGGGLRVNIANQRLDY